MWLITILNQSCDAVVVDKKPKDHVYRFFFFLEFPNKLINFVRFLRSFDSFHFDMTFTFDQRITSFGICPSFLFFFIQKRTKKNNFYVNDKRNTLLNIENARCEKCIQLIGCREMINGLLKGKKKYCFPFDKGDWQCTQKVRSFFFLNSEVCFGIDCNISEICCLRYLFFFFPLSLRSH